MSHVWTIDPNHSAVHFTVRHMVFAKVRGRFASWEGSLEMPPGDLGKLSVTATLDAQSIDTGVSERDAHLASADFLDVANYPQITFKSTRVDSDSSEGFQLHGELTIKGVTRSVVLEAERTGQAKDPWGNQRVAFSAKTAIDRTDFGLTWNQLLEAGGVLVGEKIDIELEIQAVASTAAAAAQ